MDEGKEIRQTLTTLRSDSPRRWVPEDLRRRVVVFAQARRSEGASWYRISREVGCTAGTIQRWVAAFSPTASSIAPIEIVDDHPSPAGVLTLVSPAGYRLEGLDLHQAAELLRRLR